MTIAKFFFGAAAALLSAMAMTGFAVAADYVARTYPGATADPKTATASATAFYTSDPVEKVLAFYEQAPKRAEEAYAGGAYIERLTADQVSEINRTKKIMSEGGFEPGRSMGVTISAVRLPKAGEMPMISAATLVMGVLDERFRTWGHSQSELDALHQEYDHLLTAVYMLSDKKDSSGRQLDEGVVLAEAFTAEITSDFSQGATNAADIGKKMQEAAAKGDFKELERLAAMMQASSTKTESTDHWNAGVKALSEMDQIDYRTRIVVDKAP